MGEASCPVGALVTSAGTLAPGVGVLAAVALVGASVGVAWGPFPHAAASGEQVIANTISAQRSRRVLSKEVVPSALALVWEYFRPAASEAQPVG